MVAGAPEVDVLLPTHSRPQTIGCSIRSVLGQTHRALRLHVVGDGCDAATEEVVRSYSDPRITYHPFAKGHGFGYAHRNTVLRATSAPFVAYISDDDLWSPDHLEHALAVLHEGEAALVAVRPAAVRPPDLVDPHFFPFDWRGPGSSFLRHWFLGAASLVHLRSVFGRVGYWDADLSRFGDREFYSRVRASALPTGYLERTTVLRFYALHWNALYASLPEPPQRRYLELLQDPAWCAALRAETREGRPDMRVRARQCGDFLRFGLRSGPRFLRFAWQRTRPAAAP